MITTTQKKQDGNQKLRLEMGVWLKGLREAQGMSQREMAQRLKLEYYTFISQLENGRGKIPTARYEDWASVLQQHPRDFVKTLMSYHDPITYKILFENKAS